MTYQYKAIVIGESGNSLHGDDILKLNDWFDHGWEYVSTITSGGKSHPATGAVLRLSIKQSN